MAKVSERARGFTLVEAAVSVAVLALALSVVLVGFRAARADLRASAGKLSGTLRAAYDSASLTGQTYRLEFSFEKDEETGEAFAHRVRVEASEEILSFDEEDNPLSRGARASAGAGAGFGLGTGGFSFAGLDANELEDQLDEVEDLGPPTALQALVGLSDQAEQQAVTSFESTGNDLHFGSHVRVLDVWTEGMSKPTDEGVVYLYFFPHGYTQEAYIHLTDDDDVVFTLRLHAFTGKVEVFPEYKEAPR
jgi:general secretion pathway protein H